MVASALLLSYDDGSTPTFEALNTEGLSLSDVQRFDIQGPTLSDLAFALHTNAIKHPRWLGIDWSFAGGNTAFGQDDEDDVVPAPADGGVGVASNARVHVYAGTSMDELEEVTTTADLEETETLADGYFFQFRGQDRLGNETVRWARVTGTAAAPVFSFISEAQFTSTVQPTRQGVDLTMPEIEFSELATEANFVTDDGGDLSYDYVEGDVGPSGLLFQDPYRARVVRNAPQYTGAATCLFGSWGGSPASCRFAAYFDGSPIDDSVVDFDSEAYYTTEIFLIDNAGNRGSPEARMALVDGTDPQIIGTITVPATVGPTSNLTVAAFDNLNLGQGWIWFEYANGLELNLAGAQSLGTFGLPLQQNATFSVAPRVTAVTFDGATFSNLVEAHALVRDLNPSNGAATQSAGIAALTVDADSAQVLDPFDGYSNFAVETLDADACTGADCTAAERRVRVRATMDGPVGAGLVPPFQNITILHRIQGVGDAAHDDWRVAGTVSSSSANTATGVITWATFNFSTPDGLDAGDTIEFAAIGQAGPGSTLGWTSSVDDALIVDP